MKLKKGVLKSFNSASYTAVIQLDGGYKVYLDDVAVARNIPSVEMVAGRKVSTVFFDEHNLKEAVIIAVYI